MTGNGAIAGLVAITAPSGYVEFWAAPIIGFIAGIIVVVGVIAIDRSARRPGRRAVRARRSPASGARCRAACSPRRGWPSTTAIGDGGLVVHRLVRPARRPGAGRRGRVQRRCSSSRFAVFFADQGHLRPAREARGGALRPRHRRARHVGLSRAVHAGARAPSTTSRPPAGASARPAPVARCRVGADPQRDRRS